MNKELLAKFEQVDVHTQVNILYKAIEYLDKYKDYYAKKYLLYLFLEAKALKKLVDEKYIPEGNQWMYTPRISAITPTKVKFGIYGKTLRRNFTINMLLKSILMRTWDMTRADSAKHYVETVLECIEKKITVYWRKTAKRVIKL